MRSIEYRCMQVTAVTGDPKRVPSVHCSKYPSSVTAVSDMWWRQQISQSALLIDYYCCTRLHCEGPRPQGNDKYVDRNLPNFNRTANVISFELHCLSYSTYCTDWLRTFINGSCADKNMGPRLFGVQAKRRKRRADEERWSEEWTTEEEEHDTYGNI